MPTGRTRSTNAAHEYCDPRHNTVRPTGKPELGSETESIVRTPRRSCPETGCAEITCSTHAMNIAKGPDEYSGQYPLQLRALAVQGPTFALSKTCLGRHPPVEGSLVQSKAVLRGIVRNPLREDDRVTPLVLRTVWLTCGRLPAVLQHTDSAPRLVRLAACRVGQKRQQPHAK